MKLDVRGEICPYPMIKAEAAMKKAEAGEVIEVLTDHPPALETIPSLARRQGWQCQIVETGSGEWKITLCKENA